jgi:hypothetical protein
MSATSKRQPSGATQGNKRKREASPATNDKKLMTYSKALCIQLWSQFSAPPSDEIRFVRPAEMPFDPYEWQQKAFDRVIGRFEGGGARMGICAPPGTGKSALARMIAASIQTDLPCLVVAPMITHTQWKEGMEAFGRTIVPLEMTSAPPLPRWSIVSSEKFALRPAGPSMWGMIIVDERVSMSFIRAGAIERATTRNFLMLSVEAPSGVYLRILTHLKCRIEDLYANDMIFGGRDVALPEMVEKQHFATMPVRQVVNARPDADYYSRLYMFAKMDALKAVLDGVPPGEKVAVILPAISRGLHVGIAKRGDSYFVVGDDKGMVQLDKDGHITRVPSYASGKLFVGGSLRCIPEIGTNCPPETRYIRLRAFLEGDESILVTTCAAIAQGLDLQGITHVVFLGREFDQAKFEQAVGRFRRPGAARNVIHVHEILFSHSYEMAPRRFYEYAPDRIKKELTRYSNI